MKPILLFSLLMFFLYLRLFYAQEIQNAPMTHDLYLGSNTTNRFDRTSTKTVEKTQRQLQIEKQIYKLKNLDNPANIGQIDELNRQLGAESGDFSVKFTPYPGAGVEFVNQEEPPFITDNITNIKIATVPYWITSYATATEQTGANTGRIWIVYSFRSSGTVPDSLRWLYSTNNGLTWVTYARGWLGGINGINPGDLDIEIIESASGTKYLWMTFGVRETISTGKWFTAGGVMNITSSGAGFFTLTWPGNDAAKRYYNIRLTSDNNIYTSTAHVYIVCSFDSADGSNVRVNTQKYCRCTNPYTTTPTISYQGRRFWWYSAVGPPGWERTLHSDIAYIRHGTSDSVIVSFSGVQDSTKIFFAKADISGNLPVGTSAVSQGGSEPTGWKELARLSSNGYNNGSVVCVFRQYYPLHWTVKYFRTTNYGDFSSVYQSILLGSTYWPNHEPELVGLRGKDKYYFAFKSWHATNDSVRLYGLTSSGSTTEIKKINYAPLIAEEMTAKPGFRFVTNDSCFCPYLDNDAKNLWVALGCTGPITGINGNNRLPSTYALAQNYPNPFNPVTVINFSLPEREFVTLTVYDVLGNEIEVLLNRFLNAGSHDISFDASKLASGVYFYRLHAGSFNDVKKMMLIK